MLKEYSKIGKIWFMKKGEMGRKQSLPKGLSPRGPPSILDILVHNNLKTYNKWSRKNLFDNLNYAADKNKTISTMMYIWELSIQIFRI